jgi:hypothetical protein
VDTAIEPVIELGRAHKKVSFINCGGRLEKDKLYLDDIAPFAFAGIELYR